MTESQEIGPFVGQLDVNGITVDLFWVDGRFLTHEEPVPFARVRGWSDSGDLRWSSEAVRDWFMELDGSDRTATTLRDQIAARLRLLAKPDRIAVVIVIILCSILGALLVGQALDFVGGVLIAPFRFLEIVP